MVYAPSGADGDIYKGKTGWQTPGKKEKYYYEEKTFCSSNGRHHGIKPRSMWRQQAGRDHCSPAAADKTEAAAEGETKAEAAAESGSAWEPSTTVSIVVPAGAGGNTDLSARVFARYAKELTGHDFIVVNASGAAGSVAANQVLAAAADGHTFLYGHNLVNVANIAGVTDYNYTAFKLGPTFAKDPAQQLYVSAEKYADLDLVDVGSNSDKIAAMLSGQVDLMPGAYINCKDYLESGQFNCIGAPTEERYDLIKDIPTLKEQGVDLVYPDCDFSFYFPADTSDDVIAYYEDLVQKVLADPSAAEGVANVDMMPYYLNAEDSAKNDEQIYNTIKEIADSLQQ